MTGLPDDPSNRPTRVAEYDVDTSLRQIPDGETETTADDAEPDSTPRPWYRSRVLLALWTLMLALLVTLIIYGIVELSRGGGTSPIPAPHSSTTSTGSSTTTSPTPTTTTPSASSEAPPPETPAQSPEEAPPPPANNSPAPGEPPQHHHHLHIPSTIPLPHTTITLPHHF